MVRRCNPRAVTCLSPLTFADNRLVCALGMKTCRIIIQPRRRRRAASRTFTSTDGKPPYRAYYKSSLPHIPLRSRYAAPIGYTVKIEKLRTDVYFHTGKTIFFLANKLPAEFIAPYNAAASAVFSLPFVPVESTSAHRSPRAPAASCVFSVTFCPVVSLLMARCSGRFSWKSSMYQRETTVSLSAAE